MSTALVAPDWLAVRKINPHATLRLFCFPYAGGAASIYRAWSKSLPESIDVCPVQLPGRGGRIGEPPFTRVQPLVEALAEALLSCFEKPFALFGHSMGAIISFELARLLQRKHQLRPTRLFVSARRPPQIIDKERHTYDLPEPEFIEELKRLNGTPREALEHPELMMMMMPLLRADFELCQTYEYTPGPPLDCPISAYGGLQDPDVRREHLEAWSEHTTSSYSLRMFPSDHFFLHSSAPLLMRVLPRELF